MKGISVIAGSHHALHRTGYSRYVKAAFLYPFPDRSVENAHQVVLEKVKLYRPDVLMPVFDRGWEVVYAHEEEYEKYTYIVAHPHRELYKVLTNKASLAECARAHGVAVPKTFSPKTMDEALDMKDQYPYPVLLKANKGVAGKGIDRAENASQLVEILKNRSDIPTIQEWIEGEDLELTIFCEHGKPVAGHVYLSIRNAPIPYGPPVACRSIRNDELLAIGCMFLEAIGYHGVGHLDFRRDRRDGRPKLLDFNARIAGTNEISLRTGIDFGYMQYQMATGESLKECFDYELGREFRWLFPGELRHLAETPRKLRNLGQLMKWRKVSTEVSLTDPMPHVYLFLDFFYRKLMSVSPGGGRYMADILSRKEKA
jgi:predicted ATP-grasp superfamily ATP-dependent carboligase